VKVHLPTKNKVSRQVWSRYAGKSFNLAPAANVCKRKAHIYASTDAYEPVLSPWTRALHRISVAPVDEKMNLLCDNNNQSICYSTLITTFLYMHYLDVKKSYRHQLHHDVSPPEREKYSHLDSFVMSQ
jgi:hypothetical protein